MIVVAGEALVDLVPYGRDLRPVLGGSPFNVAVALARLGVETGLLARCSTDGFGVALRRRLEVEGVDAALVETTGDPTTLALLHLDDEGRAGYRFYLDGTSAAGMSPGGLPALAPEDVLHVSLGAVTLRTEPAGTALRTLVEREAARRVVVFDPNVRPAALGEPGGYAEELERLVTACAVVKASEEDLAALHPRRDAIEVARGWAGAGVELVVVTRGRAGAVGVTASGHTVEVASPAVEVVDTVGAGDAFTAGLLAALGGAGRLRARDALAALGVNELRGALAGAARVAALACTRTGSDPPRLGER